jgi:geranylgeranyl reductase family protein
MQTNYDVIVIGAGPSGATLAFELANLGIKVLVIDKATFPRYKCCGGGLTFKAATLLGEDIGTVVENSVSGVLLAFAGSDHYRADYNRTIMYTIKRENFDYLLLHKAEKAGAEIQQGITLGSLNSSDEYIGISTSAGDFRSQFVIGADGSRSTIASSLNPGGYDNIVGIQTEITVGHKDLEKWQSQVVIDLGRTSDGYAWLFPNKDRLSTGIASLKAKGKELENGYHQFLKSLNIDQYSIVRQSGGIISICTGRPCVTRGRLALLGDAAGLADPLTGEGLYNAILSAKLAVPAIEKALLQ